MRALTPVRDFRRFTCRPGRAGAVRAATSAASALVASVAATLGPAPAAAQGYDMDCKVILCMAGGFPTGCGDAYRYMIDRITARPPKPPFGYCAMSDGTEYTNHVVRYGRPSAVSPAGYYCPPEKLLHLTVSDDDGGGRGDIEAFCYTHTTTRIVGRDDNIETTYHGRSTAAPINFEVQITVEPGTEAEYRSPLYAINFRTGFVAER